MSSRILTLLLVMGLALISSNGVSSLETSEDQVQTTEDSHQTASMNETATPDPVVPETEGQQ